MSKIISLNGDGTNNAVAVRSGTNTIAGTGVADGAMRLQFRGRHCADVNGSVSGSGSMTETGNGTLALGGAYSWSGNTTVSTARSI